MVAGADTTAGYLAMVGLKCADAGRRCDGSTLLSTYSSQNFPVLGGQIPHILGIQLHSGGSIVNATESFSAIYGVFVVLSPETFGLQP